MTLEDDLFEASLLVAKDGGSLERFWIHPMDFAEIQPIVEASKLKLKRLLRRVNYPGGRKYRSAVRRLRGFGVVVDSNGITYEVDT